MKMKMAGSVKHRPAIHGRMSLALMLAVIPLAVRAAVAARSEDSAAKYQTQYEAETDPVRKAKILAKLGPLEIDKVRKSVEADQDDQALALIGSYRDEVGKTADALFSMGVNAEKHPAGFKELQIGLRETLRRLDDLIFSLPADEHPPFQQVRSDLADTQNSLIGALFPTVEKGARKKNRHEAFSMRIRTLALASSAWLLLLAPVAATAQARKKDYLTDIEADKIRDAETPSIRIKLYLSFADGRIKKLQYELAHPEDNEHRADRLNGLINGYSGCVDDAADLIDLGVEKQQDVRDGIKEMKSLAPGFLAYLKELEAKGPEMDAYKDELDDAVDATTDAINSANEGEKENAPPPVRRKPS